MYPILSNLAAFLTVPQKPPAQPCRSYFMQLAIAVQPTQQSQVIWFFICHLLPLHPFSTLLPFFFFALFKKALNEFDWRVKKKVLDVLSGYVKVCMWHVSGIRICRWWGKKATKRWGCVEGGKRSSKLFFLCPIILLWKLRCSHKTRKNFLL